MSHAYLQQGARPPGVSHSDAALLQLEWLKRRCSTGSMSGALPPSMVVRWWVFWAMDFGCNFARLPIDAGSHQDEFDIKQGESC